MNAVIQGHIAGPSLSTDDRMYMTHCVSDFRVWVQNEIQQPISNALRILIPAEVRDYVQRLHHVENALSKDHNIPYEYSEEDAIVFRRALLHRRKAYAEENEILGMKTSHAGVRRELEERLAPVERLMRSDFFDAGPSLPLLRLTDFLTVQEVYFLLKDDLAPPRIDYDEKFGLLVTPTQFLPRLALARREAWLRGTQLGVAFVDIDDFKAFNSKHGEFVVDRSVLPVFMRALEAHVHSHGHAFRFGGDEYMLLLPNTERDTAVSFLKCFQRRLSDLTFASAGDSLTVSIGLCTAGPDSALTDRELQERATRAKLTAKVGGKNCIAWIDGDLLSGVNPRVV